VETSYSSLGLFALLGLGFVFGLKHATEVDHVIAVSAIVSEHRNVLRSALVGGLWGAGHTASLVPGDPVLDVKDADVALTGIYQGRQRMTLTYPIINRSRLVLWLVTGSEKAGMLARLQASDVSIPAGRVRSDHAVVLADRAAVGLVDKTSKTEVA